MKCATNSLDKKTAMRLLEHGVVLSSKTPPITNHQALLLLAEAVLDGFVKEFKSIVKELLLGCCLDDLKATPEEIWAWFGEEPEPAEKECHSEREGPLSYSSDCKEVDEKMKFDMQSKLDEYMRLLEQIKHKTQDERTAVAVLQEVSKDRRSAEIREERGVEQSQPATDKQKNFMKKLGIKFPDTVTKQEASTLIDEELGKNGE